MVGILRLLWIGVQWLFNKEVFALGVSGLLALVLSFFVPVRFEVLWAWVFVLAGGLLLLFWIICCGLLLLVVVSYSLRVKAPVDVVVVAFVYLGLHNAPGWGSWGPRNFRRWLGGRMLLLQLWETVLGQYRREQLARWLARQ